MLGSVIADGLTHRFAKAPGRGCTHCLSPCSQRPKPRTLHHHREEPRLLAAVWRWHRGGASLSLYLAVGVCVGPPCAPSTQPVCLCVSWCVCVVQKIDAQAIEEFYGLTSDISKNSESGYILFYQSRDWPEPMAGEDWTGFLLLLCFLFFWIIWSLSSSSYAAPVCTCQSFRLPRLASVGPSVFLSVFCCRLSPASGPHFNAKTPNSLIETKRTPTPPPELTKLHL